MNEEIFTFQYARWSIKYVIYVIFQFYFVYILDQFCGNLFARIFCIAWELGLGTLLSDASYSLIILDQWPMCI